MQNTTFLEGILLKEVREFMRKVISLLIVMCFIISGCQTTKMFNFIPTQKKVDDSSILENKNINKKTKLKLKKKKEAYLLVGERYYNKGNFQKSLNFYKKVLFLDPENEQAKVRIDEIRKWVSLIKQRESKWTNKVKDLKSRENSKRESLVAKASELETKLQIELEKERIRQLKTLSANDLTKSTLALAKGEFDKAKKLSKRAIMADPESKIAKEIYDSIKPLEEKWKKNEQLRELLEERKKEIENLKVKDIQKREENRQKIQEKKVQRSVANVKEVQKKAQNSTVEIVNQPFALENLPPAISAESKVRFLNEKSLAIFQKVIKDFLQSRKQGKAIIFPNQETKLVYDEGVAEAFFHIGKYYFDIKKYRKALIALQHLVDTFPESSFLDRAYYYSGLIYYFDKDYRNSYPKFERVIDVPTGSDLIPDSYKYMARIRNAQNKPDLALRILKGIKNDYGDNQGFLDEITILIGQTYFYKQEYEKSLESFEEVYRRKESSKLWDLAQILICEVLLKMKNYSKAQEELEYIIHGDQGHRMLNRAFYLYGFSFYDQQEYAKSIIFIEKAINKFPDFANRSLFQMYLARSYEESAIGEKAQKIYEKLINDYPIGRVKNNDISFLPEVYYRLGKIYFSNKKNKLARKVLSQLTKRFANAEYGKSGNFALGDVLFEEKKFDIAERQYRLSYMAAPGHTEGIISFYKRAKCLRFKRKYGLLEKFLKDSITINKKRVESIETIPESIRDTFIKYHYKIIFEYGDLLMELKRYDEAILYFKMIISEFKDGEDFLWSQYMLGRAFELNNQPSQAIGQYREMVESGGSGYWVERAKFNLDTLIWNDRFKEKAVEIGSNFSEPI